jgi:hypothetical protein
MSDDAEINVFRRLDFIRDSAPVLAKAKADRVHLEGYLKVKKATLMKAVQAEYPSVAAQEREAYSHPEYLEVLDGLRVATEQEEKLRWQMIAAQAGIECWRTLESSRRIEAKTV